MTTDLTLVPAYLLRQYAWQLLKRNTDMEESHYGGLLPIVPVSEEPELTEFNKPYLVYGYALNSSNDVSARKNGSMTFAVYDDDFRTLTRVLNILTTAFERHDESATDVNAFTSTIPQFVGIRFGTISVGFVEGGTPEETEGGRQSGLINIRFEYYVDYDIDTSLASWNSSTGTYVRQISVAGVDTTLMAGTDGAGLSVGESSVAS